MYIWEREAADQTTRSTQAVLPSNKNDPTLPDRHLNVPQPNALSRVVSPAHYPISTSAHRDAKPVKDVIAAGTSVRPLHVLEGYGGGAVFDVAYAGDVQLSAGEDGAVEVWAESAEEA